MDGVDTTPTPESLLPTTQENESATSASNAAATPNPEVFVALKNPRACLDGLPEELIANTVDRLLLPSLNNISRTNKRYNRLANARLYEYLTTCDLKKQYSIAQNADLAKDIKDATVNTDGCHCPQAFGEKRSDMLQILGNAVNVRSLEVWDRRGQLPNREGHAADWLNLFSPGRPSVTPPEQNSFTQLRRLSVYSPTISVQQMQSVFCIATLESLELTYVKQTVSMDRWIVPPSSCGIKTLFLRNCLWNNSAIVRILSCMKALQTIDYSNAKFHALSEMSDLSVAEEVVASKFAWNAVGNAIRAHKQTLQKLYLRDLDCFTDIPEDADMQSELEKPDTLGSLADFPQLRVVAAPLHAIIKLRYDSHDLRPYLPTRLKLLMVAFDGKRCAPEYCAAAIASIKDVTMFGDQPQFIWTMPKGSPYTQLRLSGALQALSDAGTAVQVYSSVSHGRLDITIDTLRTMESEDYEESVIDSEEDEYEGTDDEYDSFDEEYASFHDEDADFEQ
jgi:hypothetical protein